jgi:predicted ATPase/class 3 adenylate cyclase
MELASLRVEATHAQTLPSGTVTFFFTDIEGSTERWESKRDAMKGAVARHDAIVRHAIESAGGYVFKTIGDAFCASFRTAPEALRAALAVQRELGAEDFSAVDGLRVRAALHTGYADERDGDYFGPTVNRVARLLAIGHGGQILVSAGTADLARGELPPQTSLRDLGAHRLKDLAHPEQVFQLVAADLPAEFPPLKSLDALPNNLPLQVTSFVGRESDLEEVKGLARKSRLLTLVGPGGVGKTRLASQVGAELLDDYADGVWLVELATLTDADLVPSETALALNVRLASDRSLTDSIVHALSRKRALLILDNCEHLVDAVAKLVRTLLQSCPNVSIITTSREGLGIAGEDVVRVASLSLPAKGEELTAEAAPHFGAVALFADRALMANKSFHFGDDNVAAVVDICRRLDGIPFAIELAAARVKVLSITDLSKALHERFRVLTGGDRTALPRHKTMRALIDWSYDLLADNEKSLLRRLAIFAGGWTLEAASQVCQGDGIDEFDVMDLVSSLVDKSLVVAETSGETARYRLLDSTRDYALERLLQSGERDDLSRRHGMFFEAVAKKLDEAYGTGSYERWLAVVQLELDNFRSAIEWGLSGHGDVALGGSIVGALGEFWYDAGLIGEGRHWVEAGLRALTASADPGDATLRRVAAGLNLAMAAVTSGERSFETGQRALELYEALGDRQGVVRARFYLAFGLFQMGRMPDSRVQIDRAEAEARELGIKGWLARILNLGAIPYWTSGEYEKARAVYDEALAIFTRLGDERGIALVKGNLAEQEFSIGNTGKALELGAEAINTNRRLGRVNSLATALCNMAAYHIGAGHVEAARDAALEAVRMGQAAQNPSQIAFASQHLAQLAAVRGEVERAARVLGHVDMVLREEGHQREPTERLGHEKLMDSLHAKLDDARIAALAAEGAAWSEDRAVEEALKL